MPAWFNIVGLASLLGSTALAARLIWEQTVWTWDRGPQQIGASLAHPLGLVLFAFPVLLLGWLLVIAVVTAHDWLKMRRVAWLRATAAAFAVAILSALQLPYGFWQRVFIDRLSPERANELFIFAATAGDLATLKALHERGVEIDARIGDGTTALHGAAAAGRAEVVQFLLAHGAAPRPGRDSGGPPQARRP